MSSRSWSSRAVRPRRMRRLWPARRSGAIGVPASCCRNCRSFPSFRSCRYCLSSLSSRNCRCCPNSRCSCHCFCHCSTYHRLVCAGRAAVRGVAIRLAGIRLVARLAGVVAAFIGLPLAGVGRFGGLLRAYDDDGVEGDFGGRLRNQRSRLCDAIDIRDVIDLLLLAVFPLLADTDVPGFNDLSTIVCEPWGMATVVVSCPWVTR